MEKSRNQWFPGCQRRGSILHEAKYGDRSFSFAEHIESMPGLNSHIDFKIVRTPVS